MSVPLENLADGSISDRNFLRLAQAVNPVLPQARVYNSANISIANAANVAVTFDSERFDNGSLHSTSANTSRLTAPITGLYSIGGHTADWAATTGTFRQLALRVNGATFIALQQATAALPAMSIATLYQLAATDYVELLVQQNSGGALNLLASANYSPEFWMVRLGGYTNMGVG